MNEEDMSVSVENMTSDDALALSELSDKEIVLNVASINDLCSTWTSRVNSLNLTAERINSDFKTFTSYGILVDYINNLSTAINSLTASVSQVNTQISTSKDDQVTVDSSYSGVDYSTSTDYTTGTANNSNSDSSSQVNNNNYNPSIGGSSSSGSSSSSSGSSSSGSESSSLGSGSNNGTIALQDYLGISAVLLGIASSNNKVLGNLLSDTSQGTVIKEKLLGSVSLSDETKQVISNMEPEVLMKTLKSMYDSGQLSGNMSSSSINYLYNYLERVASLNGISVDELLKNSRYKDLLYSSVDGYNGAVNHFDKISNNSVISVRSDLLKIYDGDDIAEMDENVVQSVRSVLDLLAGDNNTSYEYLLNNGSEIRNVVSTMSQSKDFINNLASTDALNVQNVVSSLFSSKV